MWITLAASEAEVEGASGESSPTASFDSTRPFGPHSRSLACGLGRQGAVDGWSPPTASFGLAPWPACLPALVLFRCPGALPGHPNPCEGCPCAFQGRPACACLPRQLARADQAQVGRQGGVEGWSLPTASSICVRRNMKQIGPSLGRASAFEAER